MRPGERIGDYRIVSKIGEGGMSMVYLAERASDGTPVVVKELKEQYRFNQQLVDRFRREAEILQSLRHPHLARVFDVLLHEGKHYIIQEYLSGGSLADLVREKKPYSEEEAIRWCRDALRAMNYAHENGIVHRDLKPSNLMLDDKRQVRVIDFGIARAFGDERLTRTGDGSIGTLEYMSPEQILRPNQIDHLTDVYSMGIVLYELLSGSVPFEGPTPFSVQEKIARQPPPPLRQLGRGIEPLRPNSVSVDSRLAKLVFQAIEKSPDNRFGGCAEFALQLERYLTKAPATSMRLARGIGTKMGWSTIARVGLGLLIVILAFLGFLASSRAGAPEESQSVENQTSETIPTPENLRRAEEERRRIADDRAEAERQAQLQQRQEAARQAQLQQQQEAARQAQLQQQQEAARQAQLQQQQETARQAQLQQQQETARQAQLQQRQEAERLAQLQQQQEAARQAQLQQQQEAARQAQLQQRQEAERLAQLQKQREAERLAQIQKQQETERQAQLQKQQEAERQAQLQKQEAERLRRLEQQKADAQFFQSVMGIWQRDEDKKTEQGTSTSEVLNIGSDCSGVLTRTVTTYSRGFAGWKEVDKQTSRLTIRCDGAGRVSGDLVTQLLLQRGALVLGTSQFTRSK